MAYNTVLAERIRTALTGQPNLHEQKMFGGVGFLVNENMACGVLGDDMIIRLDPTVYEDALEKPGIRNFDFSGRPMKGWIYVEPGGYRSDAELQAWIKAGLDFALSLPAK